MTIATDTELVDAFLVHKQDSAFVELVRRYQISVYRRLALTLSDPDDAESMCETAFIVASQRMAEWPRDTELRDWLHAVAAEVSASRSGRPPDPESPRLVDPAVFFKHSVHQALHALPEEQRAILLAVDLEGQSVEQVASSRTQAIERVSEVLELARKRFTEAINEAPAKPASAAQTAAVRVLPGEIVDNRYRVERLLGEGGMATVFRAEHLTIKRKVALKTLRPTRQTQAMMRERFTREAEVLGRLAHPNFVDVSDFGESARGLCYLVMELLQGHPLSKELEHGGKLKPARALRIMAEVCNGLQFAHELGIIHRDIKPDNVVVLDEEAAQGFAKILDLGVAATLDQPEIDDQTLFGTPAYMAPEQILGTRIDGRVDLYAVGIMLFELLTGKVPFEGGTQQFVLAQQLTSTPPRLSDVSPDLPELEALQRLLDRCLAKDPAQRVKTAKLLRQEIDALLTRLGDADSGYVALPDATEQPVLELPRSSRRFSAASWLWVGATLALVCLLGWWLWR